jgi:hypothetical protein
VREVEFAHFVRCKKRNWISSSSSSIHDTLYVKLLIIDVITKKELIREICRFSLKIYGLVWCIYLSIFIVCGKVLEKSMPSFLLICDVCHCVRLVWYTFFIVLLIYLWRVPLNNILKKVIFVLKKKLSIFFSTFF